ncbi:MAG: ankyrin repeat domain-containing protein, partial [bacterium]
MKLLLLYIFFIISLSNLYGQDNNLGDDFFRYISESRALKYGHIEPVVNDLRNIFINKGLDINVKNSEGNTALHLAASTNNLSLFYVAMSFDPNPTITNNENRTAKEEVYKYMRAHGDNSASLEMYNYLENYEKSYEIRIKINMLKEIDNLESTADRIQAFDKFVESLSTINEILGTYYFYDLYKQSLITNTTKLQIENIDLKWKEKINTIIPADMSSYKKQLQATNDVKALLQLDETITEISSCVQNELSVQNRS